jgi:nucleotide-binding universal stress UspA family protein
MMTAKPNRHARAGDHVGKGTVMRRFGNILVVLDDPSKTSPVLDRAVDHVRRTGARLTLAFHPRDLREHSAAETALNALAAQLGVPAETRMLAEAGHVAVVREVLRHRHDMVMKPAVVEHGLLTHLRTSIDEHLLRDCPCAVWLDRGHDLPGYARILAAVEPDPPGLAAAILDVAIGLAALEQAELHVTHVWELDGESGMRGRAMTQAAEAEIDAMVAEERARCATWLEVTLTPFLGGPVVPRPRLEKGQPDIAIPQLVDELRIDLLVMGSQARHGLAGLIMGNTAEDMLAQTRCTLLTLKPDGFVSPITLED